MISSVQFLHMYNLSLELNIKDTRGSSMDLSIPLLLSPRAMH